MRNRAHIAFASGLACAAIPLLLLAQGTDAVRTPGVTQELLVSQALGQFPGKQVTIFTGEFAPGAATPRHRHPGTEILYVLEGSGEMHVSGRETIALEQGRAVLVQPDGGKNHFIHQAVNTGELKTLVIVIHDSNTPPALPVDEA